MKERGGQDSSNSKESGEDCESGLEVSRPYNRVGDGAPLNNLGLQVPCALRRNLDLF